MDMTPREGTALSTFRLTTLGLAILLLTFAGSISPGAVSAQQASACATGGAVPDPDDNPGLVSDCATLLAARDTLAGAATLNWAADTPMSEWDGVRYQGTPLRVDWLGLRDKGLTGEIPAGLGNLSNLGELSLFDNQLSGEIPTELGSLSNLLVLYLHGNQLTGEIPSELGNLSNLRFLSLRENQLTGEVPAELGNLSNLTRLQLHSNLLTGELPQSLTGLTALSVFTFDDNAGLCAPTDEAFQTWLQSVPTVSGDNCVAEDSAEDRAVLVELYNATDGANWADNTNWLSDEPMREWHGVTTDDEGRVTEVILFRNQLTGGIPAELGNLSNLTGLTLSGNQLRGEIPAELGNLSNLTRLQLHSNLLTGELPQSLTGLTALATLSFDNNAGLCAPVDETFQTWLQSVSFVRGSSCAEDSPEDRAVLVELYNATDGANWTSNTNWLGDRPIREWHGVSNDADGRVSDLLLGRNELTGEIPTELGSLSNLTNLVLHANQLTGEIPTELGNLSNLTQLILHANQLTGEIPTELGNLSNLTFMFLNNNQLTGELPQSLTGLTMLVRLHFDNNAGLCAPTDEAFQTWLQSVSFVSGDNCVPEDSAEDRAVLVELYNSTNGANWADNTNWLSDKPMRTWYGVTTDDEGRVAELSLSDNQLSGEIPTELGNLSNLEQVGINDNQLTGELPDSLTGLTMLQGLFFDTNAGLCAPTDEAFQTWLQSVASVSGDNCVAEDSAEDRAVLVALYNAMDGPNWANSVNWLTDAPLEEWVGVKTDSSTGRVVGLTLRYNELKGQFPPELGDLTALESLDLDGNWIYDLSTLPDLPSLRDLWLNQNFISDVSALSRLTQLVQLRLFDNGISDISPLLSLKNLRNLWIWENPLNAPSIKSHIPTLRSRGVAVTYDEFLSGGEFTVGDSPLVHNDNLFVLPVDRLGSDVPSTDYAASFYRYFDDEFDFLMFITTDRLVLDTRHAGWFQSVMNDVQGIGLDVFSRAHEYGAASKLSGVIFLTTLQNLHQVGVHEITHRWAAFVLPSELSRSSHWMSVSNINGWIGGGFDVPFDEIVDLGENQFSVNPACTSKSGLGPLELYLAGFIPPQEVPDLWVAPDGRWIEYPRTFTASDIRRYTIDDVVVAHGRRVPEASQSQREFRAAAILLIDENHPVNMGGLEKLSGDVAWISHVGVTEDAGWPNFYEATGGRARIVMDGLTEFLKDTGPASLPGAPVGLTATGNALPGFELSWSEPASDGGLAVTAYDLRYIETSSDETADSNWTVVEDVWTIGAGALQYTLSGLIAGTQYDLQVRAVNGLGAGPWSSTVVGTPTASDCTTGSAVPNAASNPGLVAVCESLLTLLDTLVEGTVLNWSADIPISEWDGIEEDSLEGTPPQVVRLYLGGLGLDGAVPSELSGLTELKELYLQDNDLSGPVPVELGDLASLTHLHLQNNDLTGGIPAELGNLTVLRELRLDSNDLTGQLPEELGSLTRVTRLWVADNDLSGSIPAELGDMANLDWLNLGRNNFSGQIPAELGNLARMRRLYIYENDLSGPIPEALGSLSRLTHIVAQANDLSGEIPVELGNLENLVWMGLHDNDLTGEIPAELGSLAKLQRLYLTNNELYGDVPEELGDLSALTNLWLNHNYLSGQIPQSLDNLDKLSRLRLAGNRFTGCLPAGLAAVRNSDADQLGLETCADAATGTAYGGRSETLGAVAPRQATTGDCATGVAVPDAANNPGLWYPTAGRC